MQAQEITTTVMKKCGMKNREQARRVVEIALTALAERIHPNEAKDMFAQLPHELTSVIESKLTLDRPQKWKLKEFLDYIAAQEGVAEVQALEHARAVFSTLKDALTPGELRDIKANLPQDFERLFQDFVPSS